MPQSRLNPQLIEKLSLATGKPQKYVREQLSKRAARMDVSSEAVLVSWAKKEGIATGRYVNSLSHEIKQEIRQLNQITTTTSTPSRQPKLSSTAQRSPSAKKAKRSWWENPWTVGIAILILTIAAHHFKLI